MSAIVAALQSVPQLMLTRESKLTKSEKQLLRQLEGILSPHGDHRAYREALQSNKSPVAIPWLGARSPFSFQYCPSTRGRSPGSALRHLHFYYIPFSSSINYN